MISDQMAQDVYNRIAAERDAAIERAEVAERALKNEVDHVEHIKSNVSTLYCMENKEAYLQQCYDEARAELAAERERKSE